MERWREPGAAPRAEAPGPMSERSGPELPTGTITFVFTDIEGSTRLVQELGTERFGAVIEEHGRALSAAFDGQDGTRVRTEGDAYFYVFRLAAQALSATVAAQRALAAGSFPHGASIRVRMGMHTGEGVLATAESGVDYVGYDVHRAARIAAAGHGGQILLSETTAALVQDRLTAEVTLRDLGSHRFKDLGRPERVFQAVIEGLPGHFPRLRSLDRTPNNLPTQLSSFIGREGEIQEGERLLEGTRLLTLTGPGGTGKTRLSIQIAAAAAEDFPDGVFFVALAPLVDPALVPSTIASELGLTLEGQRPPIDQLADHLKEKRLLLVLDNFEQILPAALQLADLLRRAPAIKMLVTSRAALRIYGEHELPVPPLALPDLAALPDAQQLSQFEAVRLFIERASATKPDFAVTNENAPAVAEICARLDGLPLAIELAAARIRLLSPQAILARLEKSLAFLAVGSRDLPARQQTLRGAIAWSYDLLDEPARRLFRVFSWFAGGGTLEEIEAVCGHVCGDGLDVLASLQVLVEHSLVRQRELLGEPRFFLLQTIREYGRERLDENADAEPVRRRHAETFLALCERAAPELMGPGRKQELDRLETALDNLRTAVDWAIGVGAGDIARRFGIALWRFWQMRGHLQEGRATFERILALPSGPDSPILAAALEAAGGVSYWQGDIPSARGFYQRCLDLCRRLGDERAIANACYNLTFGLFMSTKDEPAQTGALLDEALALYRKLGDRAGEAKTLWATSSWYYAGDDMVRARQAVEACVPMFRALGDSFGLGWALHILALTDILSGNFAAGRAALEEAVEIFAPAGDLSAITLILDDFARLEAGMGNLERAVRLTGAAAALRRHSGTELGGLVSLVFGRPDAVERLPAAAVEAILKEGAAMSCQEAVSYALTPDKQP